MAITIATLQAIITANSTGFNTAMDSVRAKIAGVEQQSGSMMASMQKVGATMTAAVTLPLLGIGAAAVKAASGFDASMRNINSIANLSEAELAKLSAQVLEFGSANRSGPAKTAEALYEIYSAGVTGAKAFDLMTIASKTAEAGMSDFSTTTKALTATVSAFSSHNLSAAEASNIWTRMVQVGVGSMEEFLSGAQRVLPSAANLGISFQNLGANIAYMSQQGGGAAMAETAVSMAMTNLMKPVKAMSAAFHKLGVVDAKGLIEKFGSLEEAVYALHGATGNEVDFAKMFSKGGLQYATTVINNIDALRASVTEFGVGLGDATQSAWDEQMKSYAAQTDRFNSSMETLMITIGSQLLPILTPLINGVTGFLLTLSKTNPEIIKFGVAFGIAAAAIGPLLLAITVLANPITLLVAGVIALGTAFATNFLGIRDVVTGVVSSVLGAIQPLITGVQALWEVLTGTGVTLDSQMGVAGFLTDLETKINDTLNGGLTSVSTKKISIPIKAGMTLSEIYYNSEWSKELQGMFSYEEFIKTASTQIAGGDPRWLQAGSTLSFGIPMTATVEPGERGMAEKSRVSFGFIVKEDFLKLKDEIQKQYDYVFTGKPLLDSAGKQIDVAKELPILNSLKLVVGIISGVVANWKDTFSVVLKNIGDGISGFVKNFTEGVDWEKVQSIVSKAVVTLGVIWLVFSTAIQGIAQLASTIIGAALPELGTVVASFVNMLMNLVDGGSGAQFAADFVQLAKDIVFGIGHFVDNLTGNKGEGLMQFGQGIRDAFTFIVYTFENAWRDLKLSINTGVQGFLESLSGAMKTLHDAKLLTDDQYFGFKIDMSNIQIDTDAAGMAKAIEIAMRNGGGGYQTVMFDGTNLKTMVQMGNAEAIAANMTTVGKENLLVAIRQAITGGDKDGFLPVALPIAIAAGLDVGTMDYSTLGADAKAAIVKALSTTSIDDGTTNSAPVASGIGKAIVDGITGEIDMSAPDAWGAIETMTDGIKTTAQEGLEINSPSKWSARLAGFIVTGFITGMTIGTILLAIASGLLANLGIKLPLTLALNAAAATTIINTFMGALVAAINNSMGGINAATGGVINAFSTLRSVVLGIGNDLASKMQGIVDRITGQLNALRSAITAAANLEVPTGPSGGGYIPPGGDPIREAASGGSVDGLTWVGERGPELVDFSQKGSVVTNRAIRDVVSGGATSQGSGTTTNVININGVQDVDKMLFELKRRGIKLA